MRTNGEDVKPMKKVQKITRWVLALATIATATWAAAQAQDTPPEGQALHIFVGKSVIINVKNNVSRALSSNPAVTETLATSPTQIVVEGKSAGTGSLILWDEDGGSQMLDIVVDLNLAGLRSGIASAYPGQQIEVQADGARVILSGNVSDPHIAEDLTKMAGLYSTQVLNSLRVTAPHERQVMLEVKFAEVDRAALTQFGVNFLSTGATNSIGTTTTGQFGSFGQEQIDDHFGPSHEQATTHQTLNQVLNLFLFRPDIHFGAVIQALQQQNILQILAEPNLLALNGQKASFLAGGEFPFPIVQGGQNVGSVTIQFKPFGVRLDFTGTIQDDNVIRLHVAPEVSTLDFTNALTLSGFTIPAVSTRRAETEIELKDGQSFGIAGLLDNRTQTQLSKIPGIGDIPILGQLFRSRNINRSNTELMVLVTPHVVDPAKSAAPAPATPKMAVPFLDVPKFDQTLPANKKPETSTQPASTK
jgi:pilus assembly protein CpaC